MKCICLLFLLPLALLGTTYNVREFGATGNGLAKDTAAIQQALNELAEFFPRVSDAKLLKSVLVKEMHATFGVSPGLDSARPHAASPWMNLFMAGDWIATGWPSTMESAARSGHLAAEAVCLTEGETRTFLEADLKPEGLMRLV